MTTKKKLLSGLFALALLATTAVGVAESKKSETKMSDLAMANIEALAQKETITIDCDDWYREECVELVINGTKMILQGRRK